MTGMDKWIVRDEANRWTRVRLICFAHAGSGTVPFHDWPRYLPRDVQVCSVRLPGRDTRRNEAPHTDVTRLVEELTAVLANYTDKPLVFFGHSMGALLGYLCACELCAENKGPIGLFVSARRAPHVAPRSAGTWRLSDRGIIEKARRLGGTDERILQNRELMDILMPAFRADLKINECVLPYQASARLPCPLIVYGGTADPEVSHEELAEWRIYTSNSFSLEIFRGGHFYFQDHKSDFMEHFSERMQQLSVMDGCSESVTAD